MLRDPYPVLTQLREAGPVFYLPDLDHYIVTRYDDIEQVLLDRDTWSAANASSPLNPVCPAAQEVLNAGFKRVPDVEQRRSAAPRSDAQGGVGVHDPASAATRSNRRCVRTPRTS